VVETPIPVDSAEGMGAKAVPLGLKQVERACGVAQPVIVAQAGREGGDCHAALSGGGYNIPPVRLVLGQDGGEVTGEQQVLQRSRKAARMMQPPRKSRAMPPRSRSQW